MFKSKAILKKEVIRYFQEHSLEYLTKISDTIKLALKEYKEEEKIETIDKLIRCYKEDINNFKTSFAELDALCAKESAVFVDASDYDSAQHIESFKRHALEFSLAFANLVDKNPSDKNEVILVQAEKIKLFDHICKQENFDDSLPEYCYFVDMEIEDGQVLVLKPILELQEYLKFD